MHNVSFASHPIASSPRQRNLLGGMEVMRLFISLAILLFSTLAICTAQAAEPEMVVVGQYLVQRRVKTTKYRALSNQINYSTLRRGSSFDLVTPHGFKGKSGDPTPSEPLNWSKVAQDCSQILKDPTVESCEPNVLVRSFAQPNDPLFSLQWGLRDSSGNDADIRASSAWDRGTGDRSTLIGIIDSGIYYDHPDLSSNLWANPGDPLDGIDNDGNGYVDDLFGVHSRYGNNKPNDCDGHGTHVAGIIAASGNNGIGVSGVNWTASLIVVNAATACQPSFTTADLVEGFNYFYTLKRLGHNIRVVNASLGGSIYSAAIFNAIARLNSVDILLVAAAGNDASNNDVTPMYPANFDLPNIISVGAVGPNLRSAAYSNYGQSVDIGAPGGDTTLAGGGIVSTYSPLAAGSFNYRSLQGTSMAAPMVTGSLGLLASQRPYLNGAHLKKILLESADPLQALMGLVAGGRYLNLGAMSLAADPPDNCPTDPNKLEPGICGCGVVDLYRDGDNDGVDDCKDSCPTDAGKTSAGACGCGVADVDTDRDGVLDCNETCSSDPFKTAPGLCGCGVSDADGNANGVIDCRDPIVEGVVPPTPTLRAGKGSVTVTMTEKTGVKYIVKVALQSKATQKPRTTYYLYTKNVGILNKLRSGSTASVSYAYVLEGTPRRLSNYSAWRRVKIR